MTYVLYTENLCLAFCYRKEGLSIGTPFVKAAFLNKIENPSQAWPLRDGFLFVCIKPTHLVDGCLFTPIVAHTSSFYKKNCLVFELSYNNNHNTALIPLEYIPCINLIFHIIQTCIVAIGNDGLVHFLELSKLHIPIGIPNLPIPCIPTHIL